MAAGGKAQKAQRGQEGIEPREGNLRARVIDDVNGLRLLSGIYAIRIRSRNTVLLIMEDYFPALGKVEGDVVFLTVDREVRLEGITGFYKQQHNEFTLLVESGA